MLCCVVVFGLCLLCGVWGFGRVVWIDGRIQRPTVVNVFSVSLKCGSVLADVLDRFSDAFCFAVFLALSCMCAAPRYVTRSSLYN